MLREKRAGLCTVDAGVLYRLMPIGVTARAETAQHGDDLTPGGPLARPTRRRSSLASRKMITSNVIHRVFRIRYKNSGTTGFTLEIEGREYVVTAKHVVGGFCDGESLDVFASGSWRSCAARCVGHAEGDRDISVLALQECLTPPGLPRPVTSKGVVYGQGVYFLGFPYGFVGHYILGDNGWPLPFVKKATVSLFDQETFLLDGHNNPGFQAGR